MRDGRFLFVMSAEGASKREKISSTLIGPNLGPFWFHLIRMLRRSRAFGPLPLRTPRVARIASPRKMLRSAVSRLRAPAAAPAVVSSRAASTLTQILDGSVWCVQRKPSVPRPSRRRRPRPARAARTARARPSGCVSPEDALARTLGDTRRRARSNVSSRRVKGSSDPTRWRTTVVLN
jgi:hypothetical protein